MMQARLGAAGLMLSAYDVVARELFDRSSTPVPTDQKRRVNGLITALKDYSYWDRFDAFMMAARWQDQQAGLLDWKRPVSYTLGGSATWHTDYGFQGDQSSGHVNTLFVPSTDAVQMTLNNFSVAAYVHTRETTGILGMMFGCSTGNNYIDLFESASSSVEGHAAATGNIYTAITQAGAGLWVMSRTASNAATIAKNGTNKTYGGGGSVSTGLPAHAMYLLARNDDGVETIRSDAKISGWFCGGAFSLAEQANIYSLMAAYMS